MEILQPDSRCYDLVIYHFPCNDGFGAAYVAWLYHSRNKLELPKFHGMMHDEELPDVTDKRVLMLDIAFKRPVMERLAEQAASFRVLDHHKTAQEELDGLEFAEFDMERSGVMLAWAHFFPEKRIPDFLQYIGLRDLWRHEGTDADAFTTAFDTEKKNNSFLAWHFLQTHPKQVAKLVARGHEMLAKKHREVAERAKAAVKRTWHGHTTWVLEEDYPWTSDVGNYLTKDKPNDIAFMWAKQKDGSFKVSLRSTGVDVGELAQQMGGGGHERAAGFRMEDGPESLFE